MSSPKYIGNYDEFIKMNEQDDAGVGGGDPFAAPADVPAAPQQKVINKFTFLFIENGKKQKKYPGGGYLKSFTSYEIKEDELIKWTDKHVPNKKKKEDVIDIVAGRKFQLTDDERAIMKDFRKSVSIGHIASKSIDVDVEFDLKHAPMTDNIEITFINTK